MTQRLLTVREVAERVGLSEWAVRRAIHDGQLAAFKPRGRLRVTEAALDDWLEASRVSPTPAVPHRPHLAVIPSPSYPQGGSFRARLRRRESA